MERTHKILPIIDSIISIFSCYYNTSDIQKLDKFDKFRQKTIVAFPIDGILVSIIFTITTDGFV